MRFMLTSVIVAAFSASSAAYADQPGVDWMPADQVRQTLSGLGYTNIRKLEADDGHWEGEGMKNGKKMEFHADAKTGNILSEKMDND